MHPRARPCNRPEADSGVPTREAERQNRGMDRRTTASGERTREGDLDRTCPAKEMAAIGSVDASGQDRLTLMRQCAGSSLPDHGRNYDKPRRAP